MQIVLELALENQNINCHGIWNRMPARKPDACCKFVKDIWRGRAELANPGFFAAGNADWKFFCGLRAFNEFFARAYNE